MRRVCHGLRTLAPVLLLVAILRLFIWGSKGQQPHSYDTDVPFRTPVLKTPVTNLCQSAPLLNYSENPESSALLTSRLVTAVSQFRTWRGRAPSSVSTGVLAGASVIEQVERFFEDGAANAKLAAARYVLDRELAALEDTRRGGTPGGRRQNPTAPVMPPPHIDDVGLPEPSTFLCRMLPDGFEVCEYENVCADVPGPALGEGHGYPSQTDGLYFVGSDIVPSFPRHGEAWPQHRDSIASLAPVKCRELVKAATNGQAWPDSDSELGTDSECLRWLRHFLRLYPLPEVSVPGRVSKPADRGFDAVFEDIHDTEVLRPSRLLPFSVGLIAKVVNAKEALSVAHGGTFPGIVTWVENLYLVRDVLEAHLWGWTQTVASPVLSAYWANMSAGWNLPPLDNLLVYGTPAWKKAQLQHSGETPWQPHGAANTDVWAMGYLRHALQFLRHGERPWRGPELQRMTVNPGGSAPTEHYPWLDAFVDALRQAQAGGEAAGAVPLPLAIPYDMAMLAHPMGTGTRMIFSVADIPLPPDLAKAGVTGDIGGEDISVTVPPKRREPSNATATPRTQETATLHTGRRRICGRRVVALGQKPLMIGGAAEGNAFRDFAHSQLGVPKPIREAGFFPPRRATVIDRGADEREGGFKTRGFANLPKMLAILDKYHVPYDLVTDMEIERMTFAEQAAIFGKNGLLIMAHGAGLSNAFAIPQRSCVIEIYPRGMWCDLYLQMMRAQGLHVFPLYSTLLGPKVTWEYMSGPKPKGDPGPLALGKECEAKSLAANAYEGDCWPEYRFGAVVTPLVEFEHALIASLELLGKRTYPIYSPVSMLNGIVQNASGPLVWSNGIHESNQWILCPPPGQVAAAGGRMGEDPHRCMYPNGTRLSGLPASR